MRCIRGGMAVASMRARHNGEGPACLIVVRQCPGTVGIKGCVAPGQWYTALIAVQTQGLTVTLALLFDKRIEGAETGGPAITETQKAAAANQMANDRDTRRIDRQVAECAMNIAQLYELKLGWFDPGDLLKDARVVAIVELALGTVCHGEFAANVFLGFVEQELGEFVDLSVGHASDVRWHHGIPLFVDFFNIRFNA